MGWLESAGAPGGAVAALCCAGAPGAMALGIFPGAWMVCIAAAALVGASIRNLLPAPSAEPVGSP